MRPTCRCSTASSRPRFNLSLHHTMIVILSLIVGFFKDHRVVGQLVSPQSGRHSPLQSHIHLARLHLDVTHILLSLHSTFSFVLSMLSTMLKADAELVGSHSAQRLHQRPSPVNTRQLRDQYHGALPPRCPIHPLLYSPSTLLCTQRRRVTSCMVCCE